MSKIKPQQIIMGKLNKETKWSDIDKIKREFLVLKANGKVKIIDIPFTKLEYMPSIPMGALD